ncbi:unnamed protein product [Diatraea saccharalis]|uniref:Uncharacterized protein n=1 Tax=Diatraea saccharalis TaxID=40085 RepID=A0A9N9WJ69_9NEOP|nr:unnamed protein product [Diatraea saccharalis]
MELEIILESIGTTSVSQLNLSIDLSIKNKEEEFIDKIKKRVNENIVNLQKINKTLDNGQENLKFWDDNDLKKYMLHKRDVDGKSFQDYESFYMESIRLNR